MLSLCVCVLRLTISYYIYSQSFPGTLITGQTNMTAEELVVKFFDSWYCENGLPLELVCNRDKLFILRFWKALTKLTSVRIKISTACHPQTDGLSEHTNKTGDRNGIVLHGDTKFHFSIYPTESCIDYSWC